MPIREVRCAPPVWRQHPLQNAFSIARDLKIPQQRTFPNQLFCKFVDRSGWGVVNKFALRRGDAREFREIGTVRAKVTGARIREKRLDLGLRQSELARLCGISASYLNLIEHNRRNIGGKLLGDIAAALGTDVGALRDGGSALVVDGVLLASASESLAGVEEERAEDFVARFPGWAGLITEQARRIRGLEQTVAALSDRLGHDPALFDAMHDILSTITGISAASAILNDTKDVDPEWQARFHRNIYEDSARLSEAGRTLVAHLDTAANEVPTGFVPFEEVMAWLASRQFRVAEIEDDAGLNRDGLRGLESGLESAAARSIAGKLLRRYAADRRIVPETDLIEAIGNAPVAPEKLAIRFGTSLSLIFRRLAILAPSPLRPAMGLVTCDASGAITFRKSIDGFRMPRFGGSCARWPLFAAVSRPSMPIKCNLKTVGRDGRLFRVFACTEYGEPRSFRSTGQLESSMLLIPDMDERADADVLEVGMNCRTCALQNCDARREPSLLAERSLLTGV